MPRYDIRCRSCGATFEVQRSMATADDPAQCPNGHDDTVRLLPTIAVTGIAAGGSPAPAPAPSAGGGGGCCGGGCCA
jgi:putative FmdB family regulatory protein